MPSAIAPEDTSTTSLPCAVSAAICSAQRDSAAWSSPRPSAVTRLEPTLTTMRRACLTTECISAPPSQAAHGLTGLPDVDAVGAEMILEQGLVIRQQRAQLDAFPAGIARLRPGAVGMAVGIQATFAGFAAQAFEGDVLRSARRVNHHGIANHLVLADADRCGIDKMPVARGRRHVELDQIFRLGIRRQLGRQFHPGLFVLELEIELAPFGVHSQGQDQQQGRKDFHARHFIDSAARCLQKDKHGARASFNGQSLRPAFAPVGRLDSRRRPARSPRGCS